MLLQDKKLTGEIIKKHRKNKKLTQEQLAEIIGISEKHVGQIERGAFQPNIVNFFKIIQTLEIDLKEFGINLDNKDNKKREELIKLIYSLEESDIELCLGLVLSVKKYSLKN